MSGCSCSPTTSTSSGCGCSDSQRAVSVCPTCHHSGIKISDVTFRSQVQKELIDDGIDASAFNFCTNPSCSTVYYEDDGMKTFGEETVKSKVTIKNSDPTTPLCYCQKLLKKDFYAMLERGEENIAEKIKDIIASGKSFCEKSNPKGICCTEDVKVFLAEHGLEWDSNSFEHATAASCC